ncbi:MAG TPA: FAD:protein FMN transferase [Gemmataceae bacterium]|nr:FAD:protein FMN transferase [Gemmataceae bacterium]
MKTCLGFLAFSLLFVPGVARADSPMRFEYEQQHMGTKFRIVLYAANKETADRAAKEAFTRVAELNRIMSDYDPKSELMQLCAQFDQSNHPPVKVSPDLFFVLSKGQELAKKSDGAFDMTVGPVVKLWRIARRIQKMPEEKDLAEAKSKVGYQKMELDEKERTVRLLVPGMRLDLGGIAKGYAADEVQAVLKKDGITSALVAAGGDIAVSDAAPNSPGWKIGIEPLTKDSPQRYLRLHNAAVSTSGDAEQFTLINGVRYSHIIDPKTGLGLSGRRSVTVVAQKGIDSDSMTKAVMILPPKKALELVEATDGAAAMITVLTDKGEEVKTSKRWAEFLEK